MSNKKDIKTIDTVSCKKIFSDCINQAAYGKTRVILTRWGKPIAAIVSMEDFSILEQDKK